MVFGTLIEPLVAERRPYLMVLLGFLFGTIGLFFGYWVFQSHASLVMVFLTVLMCVPIMYKTLTREEQVDVEEVDEPHMMWEHAKALNFLMFLFIGITAAFTLWYLVLPSGMAGDLFSVQVQTYTQINSQVSGNVAQELSHFSHIFFNNLKVLIFCLLFSLTFGLGAIFIIVWNASVISVALGNFIRSKLSTISASAGLPELGAYLSVTSWGIIRYGIHGVFEIGAYFIVGLAGGIIAVAISKHDFGTKKMEKILLDCSELIIGAIVILVFAALIETFVTPYLF